MDQRAPAPGLREQGDTLWLAYRTDRPDHFAVLCFSGVQGYNVDEPGDAQLGRHPAQQGDPQAFGFHEVADPELLESGLRRWLIAFPDRTVDVIGHRAEIAVRAIQAADALSALTMVEP